MFKVWIKTSRFYKPEFFSSGNHQHRKRIKNRPLYIEFLKYIGIDEVETISETEKDYIKISNEALDYFQKHEELESINKAVKKAKVIHDKFNGNMLKEMGYNGTEIGTIIKKFKSATYIQIF